MNLFKRVYGFVRQVASDFMSDDALSLAAAVAFYTALSFAPLVLLLVTFGGFLGDRTQNELVSMFSEQLGPSAADVTQTVVETAEAEMEEEGDPAGGWRWVFGTVVLLITASTVFAQLQASLNRVWDVVPKPSPGIRGWWAWLRKRLLSLGMVLSVLFILLASLVVSTVVEWLIPNADDGEGMVGRIVVLLVSFGVSLMLFAAMFKLLPDVVIPWRDVWFGAFVTAILFNIGKVLLSIYLDKGNVGKSYGTAAGGLIALLVWVYYSCIVLLIGAEITQAYARVRGSRVRPNAHAQWSDDSSKRPVNIAGAQPA